MKEKYYKKYTINGKSVSTFTKDTWIVDSGASSYITNDDSRLEDIKITNEVIYDTTGTMIATIKGKKKGCIMQTYGTFQEISFP